ncbi:zf-C2H2 zinc finger, C2H2 type [Scheffersomyces xylosifermentans]|uniref:zf-C2H2 zinc finger, C2H2 type n=1 Tax=Scheffersomyces xylosifermentans TaxID=1304137 RepID=UPI00315DE326
MKVGERYVCDVPDCGKSFSRSDHLSRHKFNHEPRAIHTCSCVGCNKSFVRKDVKEKHEFHHRRKIQKQKLKLAKKQMAAKTFIDSSPICPAEKLEEALDTEEHNTINDARTEVIPQKSPNEDHLEYITTQHHQMDPVHINQPMDHITNAELSAHLASVDQYYTTIDHKDYSESEHSKLASDQIPTENALLPIDLTQWLFNDNDFLNQRNVLSPFGTTLSGGTNANHMLEEAFCISPNFPQYSNQNFRGAVLIQKLCGYVPQLHELHFDVEQLRICLDVYWAAYHVQFPILHRPSFSADDVHPFLLLSMIMMGAGLMDVNDSSVMTILPHPQRLADSIAVPLRWLISSSEEFGSPTRAWMIQSLIILETYEILFSNRKLHERAYLHHGLKIQLLRRSALLGGDPLNRTSDDSNLTEEKDIWKKWIEIESLKRAALVSFYLDTIHATIFGHEIVLFAHQIKLSMPCDDMLWEMSVIDKNNLPPQTETPRFIVALTKLLHQEQSEASSLSKKLLLAGLLTIKFQMEQKDLQMTFLDWKSVEESWKSTIYKAIDVWRDAVCHGDCCDTRNAFYLPSTGESSNIVRSGLSLNDTKCKFPIYHLCQAFMRVKQYDMLIYAGSPRRMSVKTTERDYRVVEGRIKQWANSANGKISVLHCYILLNEIMFNGEVRSAYDPDTDPILYRPNIVASSLFVIWVYNYCLYGPESLKQKYSKQDNVKEEEEGYDYISRIYSSLINYTGEKSLNYKSLERYSKVIDNIPNKHFLVGLLKLFKDKYILCRSEICREYAELISNCILRSTGKEREPFT